MPIFEQEGAANQSAAVAAWEALGYDIVPLPYDQIIYLAGAVHCMTKTLPELPELYPSPTPSPEPEEEEEGPTNQINFVFRGMLP